ncbi:MAG: hypothetical protein EXS36_05865 [Pedosphaera sp.]|nr:hypothetical protein [Pedosphaera sp.]
MIQKCATRLYFRATLSGVTSAALGGLIGLVGAPYILQALPSSIALKGSDWMCAALLGLIGLGQGLERASQLKLQAQRALCQLQIEHNTRGK